jgi:hypothetical protein
MTILLRFKTIIFFSAFRPRMMLLRHRKQVKDVSTMSYVEKRLHRGNNNAKIGDVTGYRFQLAEGRKSFYMM